MPAGGYFNPRSSCEERRDAGNHRVPEAGISIHAPHARSDGLRHGLGVLARQFQSTLLMRGATFYYYHVKVI